jgi:hypothetical protein
VGDFGGNYGEKAAVGCAEILTFINETLDRRSTSPLHEEEF